MKTGKKISAREKRKATAKNGLSNAGDLVAEYQQDVERSHLSLDVLSFIEDKLGGNPVGAVTGVPTEMVSVEKNLPNREVLTSDPEFISLKNDIALNGLQDLPQVYFSPSQEKIITLNGNHRVTACQHIYEEARLVDDIELIEKFETIPVRFVEEPSDYLQRIDRQFKSNELRKANTAMDTAEFIGCKIEFFGGEDNDTVKLVSTEIGMDINDVKRYLKIYCLPDSKKQWLRENERFLSKTVIKNAFKKSISSEDKLAAVFEELEDKLFKRTSGKRGKLKKVKTRRPEGATVKASDASIVEEFSEKLSLSKKEEELLLKFVKFQREGFPDLSHVDTELDLQ